MTRLYDRKARLTVDVLEIEDLDFAFNIEKSTAKEPNTAEIKVFNLKEDNRNQLHYAQRGVETILQAGYRDNLSVLFIGNLKEVQSVKDGVDWVTTVRSGDGQNAAVEARYNKSYAPGTSAAKVVGELADALGINTSKAARKIRQGVLRDGARQFVKGTVVKGSTYDELDRLLRSMGFEWSVQDGELQVMDSGGPTENPAVLLSPESGLIGSPVVGSDGVAHLIALIQPGLQPGRKIEVESLAVQGLYRIERVVFNGSTEPTAGQWYAEIEAKAL
jgi:hypothetical protein